MSESIGAEIARRKREELVKLTAAALAAFIQDGRTHRNDAPKYAVKAAREAIKELG